MITKPLRVMTRSSTVLSPPCNNVLGAAGSMTVHTDRREVGGGRFHYCGFESFKHKDVVNDKRNTLGLTCARSARNSSAEASTGRKKGRKEGQQGMRAESAPPCGQNINCPSYQKLDKHTQNKTSRERLTARQLSILRYYYIFRLFLFFLSRFFSARLSTDVSPSLPGSFKYSCQVNQRETSLHFHCLCQAPMRGCEGCQPQALQVSLKAKQPRALNRLTFDSCDSLPYLRHHTALTSHSTSKKKVKWLFEMPFLNALFA